MYMHFLHDKKCMCTCLQAHVTHVLHMCTCVQAASIHLYFMYYLSIHLCNPIVMLGSVYILPLHLNRQYSWTRLFKMLTLTWATC